MRASAAFGIRASTLFVLTLASGCDPHPPVSGPLEAVPMRNGAPASAIEAPDTSIDGLPSPEEAAKHAELVGEAKKQLEVLKRKRPSVTDKNVTRIEREQFGWEQERAVERLARIGVPAVPLPDVDD